MKGRLRMSLNLRLWAVVLLAVVPVFVMVVLDYRAQRRELARDLEENIRRMLSVSAQQEVLALESVRSALKMMSRANDLEGLDPQACSALAARMLDSLGTYNNLGAVLPDGRAFCSGRGAVDGISVADRDWFIEAHATYGLTSGDFVTGRIFGQPTVVFGYPVRADDGTLRAVLFASTGW